VAMDYSISQAIGQTWFVQSWYFNRDIQWYYEPNHYTRSTGENFNKLTFNNPGKFLTQIANPGSSLTVNDDLTITAGTLSLGPTTSNLVVGGRANITSAGSALIFSNSTTQTTSVGNILSGSGTIDMSGGNLPHVLNLAGSSTQSQHFYPDQVPALLIIME